MSAASSGNGGGDATAPFVSQLRSRPGVIRIAGEGQPSITLRAQVLEVWDTVRLEVPPTEPVLAVKVRALEALYPEAEFHDDFVVKLNGFEVLDENASVTESGAVDGSTYLIARRRRTPIRT
jgi:hypothetical protein